MATKAALAKAYDGGQAAQRYGYGIDSCPFAEDESGEEYNAWHDGYEADLASKWLQPGRAHNVDLNQ